MTINEARRIVEDFINDNNPSAEEEFLFIEAMKFLIDEEHDPGDMMHLGGYYYELKAYDLALKYYEMADSYDYDEAGECLGYIWYYGRTGECDYEKAYGYFSKLMEKGHLVATYKVADMYRNGYYVEKDQAKYEEIIEDLFPKVQNLRDPFAPVPEVFTRLGRIRVSQKRYDEAEDLYLCAKSFLAHRIRYNAFWGNLNIMKWLVEDLYELIEFDEDHFDFYDLYYILKTPHRITFLYDNSEQEIRSVMDGEEAAVCFNGKWFSSIDDFFKKATLDDEKLTAIYKDLSGFEVRE